jgi:hypothetical protein
MRIPTMQTLAMQRLAALVAVLSVATTALAQPNPADFDLPAVETDALYHVELILFAFNDGNRFEEDLLHGIENAQFAPPLKLLRVPTIELESVFGITPNPGFGLPGAPPAADDPSTVADATAITAGDSSSAETLPLPRQAGIDADNPDSTIPAVDPLRDRLELLELTGDGNAETLVDSAALPAGFRPLTNDELELNNVAARMNRRPYTLLGHAGWAQTGVDTDRSVELDLRYLGVTNPTGTIEVYARRYLHAVVDFVFYEGSGTFWSAASDFGIAPLLYAQSYEIEDEVNAIRSGDSLYLVDHPLYGVLIQIRRAPEPADETGTQTAGGPAG